jgi:CheY-like chemotaxis protein
MNARRRILVVDDEQDIIDVLQEHLSSSNDVDPAVPGSPHRGRLVSLTLVSEVASASW